MSRTNFSTYVAIKSQLLNMFKTETFPNNKLPSEAELAETLDISLSTLREALMMLALEGYITKRHGAGNYVHPSTLNFENRIFFAECLRRNGYTVRMKIMSQSITEAGEEIARALCISPSDTVLSCTNIHSADGQPAIVSIITIPQALFVNGVLSHVDGQDFEYLHEMMWKYCRRTLAHSLNEYGPLALPASVAKIFNLPEGTPIITNNQVFYDTYDTPVMHSYSYFYPNLYKVHVLQNWALGQGI
ncbi:MAG: GntR family transcriptional regulator [Bacillota bacterium]